MVSRLQALFCLISSRSFVACLGYDEICGLDATEACASDPHDASLLQSNRAIQLKLSKVESDNLDVESSPIKFLHQSMLHRAASFVRVPASRTGLPSPPDGGAWADGCRHVFLDVGCNLGVHVRALFQPDQYAASGLQQTFNTNFGDEASRQRPSNESGICAFGFDGNGHFAERHRKIERAYAARGWRVKFFSPVIVHTEDGMAKFFVNHEPSNEDWGSSIVDRGHGDARERNFTEVTVPSIDFAAWVAAHIMGRKLPAGVEAGKVFMKMDIEGAEFDVIPAMRDAKLLCQGRIDAMTCEEHTRIVKFANASAPRWPDILRSIKEQPGCATPTKVENLDDESYLHDPVPIP